MNRIVVLAAGLASLSLITGCSTTAEAPAPSASSAAPGSPAWSSTPILAKNVQAAIDNLDQIGQQAIDQGNAPGLAIVVAQGDQVVYAQGFGVRNVDTGEPVDADTTFQLASISKPVGASVVAGVVGDGIVAWDTPVVEHLPYFQLADPWVTQNVTIGDLYAMRGGIPFESGDDLEELGYDRQQIIERFRLLPLLPFRAESAYTNYGLTAGAESVAQAVGKPWEQLSKERLYEPLGMTRTTSVVTEFEAQPNHATLHVPDGENWRTNGNRNEQGQAPAGTVSSSANDFGKWLVMQLNNGAYNGQQVISAEALAQSRVPRIVNHTPASSINRPSFYGYGIGTTTDSTGRVAYRFSGAFTDGASTAFAMVPETGLAIAAFTNGYPQGVPEAIVAKFFDQVENGNTDIDWFAQTAEQMNAALSERADAELSDQAPASPPATDMTPFVGTYANAYYGAITITAQGSGLRAVMGPAQMEVELTPLSADTFGTIAPDGSQTPLAKFNLAGNQAQSVEFSFLKAPDNNVIPRQNG